MGRLTDYIAQIHQEMESHAEEFRSRLYSDFPQTNRQSSIVYCPSCGSPLPLRGSSELNFCPLCGASVCYQNQEESNLKHIYQLPHYDGLEEETKAKIGTFEKVYKQTFQSETGYLLVEKSGFDQLDYSPLINPLASGLEIELGMSIGKLMRTGYGKDSVLLFGDKKLELSGALSFSLRGYELCMKYDYARKNVIKAAGFPLDEKCFALLDKIISIRNSASHKGYVPQERFFQFYENIYSFFELYIDKIIAIKEL